jgi:hypothetical protein
MVLYAIMLPIRHTDECPSGSLGNIPLEVGTHCGGPGRIDQRRCYSAVSRNLPPRYFSGFTGQDADRAAVDICAPIAIEAVKRIDELFAIEREIDGLTPSGVLRSAMSAAGRSRGRAGDLAA